MEKEAYTRCLKETFAIEAECLREGAAAVDMDEFEKAVKLLAEAPKIGASGCGHSGIACRDFAHLMCCIERPARFISPAEAVHGATGFLEKGDAMLFLSRGGKTGAELRQGRLADIAPTILDVMGLAAPEEMDGQTLIVK